MSNATATAEVTFVVEVSYDAFTMDRTASWEPVSGYEPFHSEQAAEDSKMAYGNEHEWFDGEAFLRVRKVVGPRPEVGYSDPFLEAEFAANRAYWSDRAAAARQQEEAQAEMFRLYGKGSEVKVVKGRKVPVGTEGTVFWLGESTYDRSYRVGFKASTGEKFYTALGNVESTKAAQS